MTNILNWNNGTQWANEPNLGEIYADKYVHQFADYTYSFEFWVGDGRTLGILFVRTEFTIGDYTDKVTYNFGQFHNNSGAKKFAQFALNDFIESFSWESVPSLQVVETHDNGGPLFYLNGEEVLSTI
jgi:hypothetical protein